MDKEVKPLFEYQKRAVEWLLSHDGGYLAVDMGLGKTRIVLEYIRTMKPECVLVIAPKIVALNTWPEQIREWATELTYTILHGRDKDENIKLKRDIYIINYDGLKWLVNNPHGRKFHRGLLVLDESTMIKSPQSGRFKALKNIRAVFTKCICMSGTPAPNGYQDLWSQYFLIDFGKTLGSQYSKFFNRYFRETESRRIVPYSTELLKEIPKACAKTTFRLSSDDYLKLPEWVDNDIYIDLPPKARAMYKKFEEDFFLQLSDEASVTAVNMAVLSSKLRQFCQGALYVEVPDGTGGTNQVSGRYYEVVNQAKLDALESVLRQLNGQPTLLPIQFSFELAELKKRFGRVPALVGGVCERDQQRYIDAWNRGELPFLVCHPASISHGVNLQTGGHYITWLALTWNYEHYSQLNGRIRRTGQKHTCIRNRIIIKGTVEEKIAAALNYKGCNQQYLLDTIKNLSA